MASRSSKQYVPPKNRAADDEGSESSSGESAGRAMWSGSISFGLVQIPVKMRPAERGKELSFHQLDKHDHSRIRYERVNAKTGKKVEWGDIVKGYEVSRGSYVVVDPEDFERASPEATHTIDIQAFVQRSEIPIEYFERPYYLVPERNGARAYAVLREALSGKELVAITRVVLRTKQHLAAIMPEGDALVLVLMRFESEIVPVSSVESELPKKAKASPQEMKLAEQLVETLTAAWDPSQYVDTYTRELKAALEQKAETGTISVPEGGGVAAPSKVMDLLSLLQQSVAANGKTKAPSSPGVKRAKSKHTKDHAA